MGLGADRVRFDFAGADATGSAIERVRTALDANVRARAGATALLDSWAGSYRARYDEHRAKQEAVLTTDAMAAAIAGLRRAWDEAAAAQVLANRRASATACSAPMP